MSSKKKGKKKKKQSIHQRLVKLWEKGQSKYCEVRGSEIHGRGVYATTFIPKDQKVIEYVGELIDKEESNNRGIAQHEHALKTGDAAVYIFTIDKHYDLDGNMPWNIARLINHSCAPNCEAIVDEEERKIFIHAVRDINPGEELSFDYGFDIDCYEEHPCLCGQPNCVGYIVGQDSWPDLKKLLKKKEARKSTKKQSQGAKA